MCLAGYCGQTCHGHPHNSAGTRAARGLSFCFRQTSGEKKSYPIIIVKVSIVLTLYYQGIPYTYPTLQGKKIILEELDMYTLIMENPRS